MEGFMKNQELNTFIASNLFPYLCQSNFRQNEPDAERKKILHLKDKWYRNESKQCGAEW